MLFDIAVCNVTRIYIKLLWFSLKHDNVSNVASQVLETKQKEFTFVLAYACSFIITWMLIQYEPLRWISLFYVYIATRLYRTCIIF